MIRMTPAATGRLKEVLAKHPEESIVRLTVTDLDEQRLALSIVLDAAPRPDDELQEIDGLTIGMAAESAARLHGVTLDYQQGSFLILHPEHDGPDPLHIIHLN